MKKFLLAIVGFFLLLVVAAAVIPIIYKDDIKAAIDAELAKSVNAQILFDGNKFGISLFKNFPDASVTINDFGIIGNAPFAGDTLTHIGELTVAVNLWSLITGNMEIEGLYLQDALVNVKVLEDGKANYDISVPAAEEAPADTAASDFQIKIKEWEITNSRLVYDDRSLAYFMELEGMNHSGTGDFTLEVFDMYTNTHADSVTVMYDGIAYLDHAKVDAEVGLNMDLSDVFTFKFLENKAKVNDFTMGFDGWFKMPENGYEMDITFAAKENEFKNILSLVPGVFMEGFENLETKGSLAFDGFVKGMYSDTQMPGFKVNLQVKDGYFKYPQLPTAVSDINVDMMVDNTSGDMEKMLVDIRDFALNMGNNPIKGRVKTIGLTDIDVDVDVNAKLNLAELSSMFPIEGLDMKGLFTSAVKAKGVYSDAKKTMPTIDADLNLANGFVKYADYPIPMDQINVHTTVKNGTGILNDTRVQIEQASMLVDGEPFSATGLVHNFDDITYDFNMNGMLDLVMIDKIYPLEGMKLAGKVKGNIATKGKMSDIDAERYEKLATSGRVEVTNLEFVSTDLPQGLKITSSVLTFNPKDMVLENYEGFLGKSDVQLTGRLSNYVAFALQDDAVLQGNMKLYSKFFDTNEWMTEEETTSTETTTDTSGVAVIPKNVDFRFDAQLDKVAYTNLTMSNMTGNIQMKDGIMTMNNLKFNMLGGQFVTNGAYNTADPAKPKFAFDLGIQNLSFKESYSSFNTVQMFAPLAQNVDGSFSTMLKLNGDLGQDMMPVYQTLTGGGNVIVKDAALIGVKVLEKLGELTKIGELKNPALKDLNIKTSFEDGKMKIAPFDLMLAGMKSTVEGFTSFDGKISYKIKLDVPASRLGGNLAAKYASFTGQQTIPLAFNVSGAYNDPQVAPTGDAAAPVADAAKEKVDEVKEQATEQVVESAKDLIQSFKTDSAKPTENIQQKVQENKQEVKNKINEVKKLFPAKKDTTKKQ